MHAVRRLQLVNPYIRFDCEMNGANCIEFNPAHFSVIFNNHTLEIFDPKQPHINNQENKKISKQLKQLFA